MRQRRRELPLPLLVVSDMKYYAYKMAHDYGFAPNPFNKILSLANCKSTIRLGASVGDWVIGTGSKTMGLENRLIHLMQVSEKLTFSQYWNDPRFAVKKPVYNGSLLRLYGDNIYYPIDENTHGQIKSFHSNSDGSTHVNHLNRDIRGKYVLLSNKFWYFGNQNFLLPKQFLPVCSNVRDAKLVTDRKLAAEFVDWVSGEFKQGMLGVPINWIEHNQLQLAL